MKPSFKPAALAVGLAVGVAAAGPAAQAASHREAPITAVDHKADITDFFAFVSYDDPTKVTMILNVDPLLEPSNGPNYFPFDDEIRYTIRVDNNHDAETGCRLRVSIQNRESVCPACSRALWVPVTGLESARRTHRRL